MFGFPAQEIMVLFMPMPLKAKAALMVLAELLVRQTGVTYAALIPQLLTVLITERLSTGATVTSNRRLSAAK